MKYRSLFVSSLLILSSLLSFDAEAQTEEGWRPPQQTVERLSKNQPEFNYYEEKVPSYTLPEVLTTTGGRKVTSPRLWNKVRREEILELFRGNVYGRVPSTPYTKSFKVVNEDKNAMGGAATLKQVDITITADAGSLVIHLTMFVPNYMPNPAPVYLLINNRGPANTD
ncbi:MAG TPA: hypothetical protein VMW32_04335, partial [Bacteroidales bacterium]|nr:hypothetical protein [Bacteroidales bacterium]